MSASLAVGLRVTSLTSSKSFISSVRLVLVLVICSEALHIRSRISVSVLGGKNMTATWKIRGKKIFRTHRTCVPSVRGLLCVLISSSCFVVGWSYLYVLGYFFRHFVIHVTHKIRLEWGWSPLTCVPSVRGQLCILISLLCFVVG